jgi:hypothetical protein
MKKPQTQVRKITTTTMLLAGVALCALATQPAGAATVGFTASGTGSDGPLAADAVFTTSAGHVSVTITNDLSAGIIRSAGQAISDLIFTLSNAPGTFTGATATGQLGNVGSDGSVTLVGGSPTRWEGTNPGGFSISGNTITLEAIGGGQPSQMLLPAGTSFPNANGGSLGGGQFDPFIIGPATFNLALAGIVASTTITSARFSFGTGPDTFLNGTPSPSPVPIPGAIWLFGGGIAGLAALSRRRRKQAADNYQAALAAA